VVRVAAPALDGRANRALCRLFADRLGVAHSRVVIVRGHRSREKLIQVEGPHGVRGEPPNVGPPSPLVHWELLAPAPGTNLGTKLTETEKHRDAETPANMGSIK
ncbi:MAG: hypothetical protein JWO23_2806, partial [Solirubrobacterales bacterium]|nr:hypothetical protein [Solirubrobacterales bacterium]